MKHFILVIATFTFITVFNSVNTLAQQYKEVLFDIYHGQNSKFAFIFDGLLNSQKIKIKSDSIAISDSNLKGKYGLILFSPTKPFSQSEKNAIEKFLLSGGSLLLIFDEESRMKLLDVGVNDFVIPFGIGFTGDVPVRHNCGAIAEKSRICQDKRELPYSGGRSIVGGHIISTVFDDGNYVHSAWKKTPKGGKIIMMSDGMAGLLMGMPDGIRFNGTGPSDSKYWGKDSKVFMQEILNFFIK